MVDLPAPEGPTRATTSPGRTARSMPARTRDVAARGVGEGDALEVDAAFDLGELGAAAWAGWRACDP